MNPRTYFVVSGVVFAAVAGLHLLRVINGWPMMIGTWAVPMSVSWVGTTGPAILAVWAFGLSRRPR